MRNEFLSITGPKADIDRVVCTYLSRYEIHLENALSELKTVKDLRPYIESNPYKEELAKAGELVESYHELLPGHTDRKLKLEDAVDLIHALDSELKELTDKRAVLWSRGMSCRHPRTRWLRLTGLIMM